METKLGERMLENLEVFYKLLIALSLVCLGISFVPTMRIGWAIVGAVLAGIAALLMLLVLLS